MVHGTFLPCALCVCLVRRCNCNANSSRNNRLNNPACFGAIRVPMRLFLPFFATERHLERTFRKQQTFSWAQAPHHVSTYTLLYLDVRKAETSRLQLLLNMHLNFWLRYGPKTPTVPHSKATGAGDSKKSRVTRKEEAKLIGR